MCCGSTTTPTRSTRRRCWPPNFGFLPGDDERLRATVIAIANDLTEDGFVLRYRTDETDDGLSGKEGTFLICSFWLVSALAVVGELQAARDLMERLLRVGSPLGLYAEEFDAGDRAPPRQLPPGVLAPGPDRGGGADHRRPRAPGAVLMDAYDVIIMGTGAGGGTLARHLAPSGKRILLLERGDWLPREPQNWRGQDVFVDNRYVSPDTWYDDERQAVPTPGPLLRRRRDQALRRGALPAAGRGLRRAAAPRRGVARVADHLRRARAVLHAAEQLYQVHGARGEDPTEPPASAPYPFPAVSHEPRIQQLADDLAAAGYHPFHAPCGVRLDEANMPYSACVRCVNCDGFPCAVHGKSDAEVLGVRPALEHPNVTLLVNARVE